MENLTTVTRGILLSELCYTQQLIDIQERYIAEKLEHGSQFTQFSKIELLFLLDKKVRIKQIILEGEVKF